MPTSTYSQIPVVVAFLQEVMPGSILDIGLGNGKMGFIARDLLDVMLGERYRKEEWKVKIDGIEVFADYVQDHQRAIYDDIHIGDAYDAIDRLGTYDLVILGDVLEHFKKERAYEFLDKCFAHCRGHMLLSIPLGEWTQPEIYGNPHEEHLSFWTEEDFDPFVYKKHTLDFPDIGLYGTFLIRRDGYLHHRAREKAEKLLAEGKKEDALAALENFSKGMAPDINTEMVLIDLLLQNKKTAEAKARAAALRSAHPEDAYLQDLARKLSAL